MRRVEDASRAAEKRRGQDVRGRRRARAREKWLHAMEQQQQVLEAISRQSDEAAAERLVAAGLAEADAYLHRVYEAQRQVPPSAALCSPLPRQHSLRSCDAPVLTFTPAF